MEVIFFLSEITSQSHKHLSIPKLSTLDANIRKKIKYTWILPFLLVTKPPLFSIVWRSFIGSWSTNSWQAIPPSLITAQESPTFPTTSFSPLITITVTAVEPPLLQTSFLFLFKILWSVFLYALLIAVSVSVQKSGCLYKMKISLKPKAFERNGVEMVENVLLHSECCRTGSSGDNWQHRFQNGHQI